MIREINAVILFISLLLLGYLCFAEIVEVTGSACDPNVNIAKEKALKDAKRNAVERYVGTLINSRTLVIKGRLLRDIIQTKALGKVKVIGKPVILNKQVDPEKGFCCIKLKTKLEIKKEQIVKPPNFHLRMVLNKKEFNPGDEMQIYLYAKQKCHPYLFSIGAEGKVYRLLPNRFEKAPVLKGNMVFPTEKMMLEGVSLSVYPIRNSNPVQEEELLLICTREKEDALLGLFPEAFIERPADLTKFFTLEKEKLIEVLEQIGEENYDMVDEVYWVRRNRK